MSQKLSLMQSAYLIPWALTGDILNLHFALKLWAGFLLPPCIRTTDWTFPTKEALLFKLLGACLIDSLAQDPAACSSSRFSSVQAPDWPAPSLRRIR